MKLYNTLNKQIEILEPIQPPMVTVYTCGPTVYDYPHIGNWFTFIRYDLLVRTLELAGLQPRWVMNITDVGHLVSDADEGEDKLEKGARRENKTAWDVAKFYGDDFVAGLQKLNFRQPDYLTKATEHIHEQIELIQSLERKGYTYAIDDGIYFDTSKFASYSDFAQLDVDEQQAGKRVEFNTQKRNSSDFALWKFSPKDQKRDMEWESPWGTGFPGWHLECSAMAMKYLGETIDIHSGGIDHIPVHHTNEIAQSEAATGKQFARYWMHTNHISIDGEKISKSLGNTITLQQIESKGFEPEVLRLHVLESHYRSQSRFSWESLEAAANRLDNLRALADLQYQTDQAAQRLPKSYLDDAQASMSTALLHDLHTPEVLRVLSDVVDTIGQAKIHPDDVDDIVTFLQFVDKALGLTISNRQPLSEQAQSLLAERQLARDIKDWPTSDKLRDDLMQIGVSIRDTPLGTIWHTV